MGWQDVVALTIVGLCAAYVLRAARRALKGQKGGCGCGKSCVRSVDIVSIESASDRTALAAPSPTSPAPRNGP